jgi:hypothetical protein
MERYETMARHFFLKHMIDATPEEVHELALVFRDRDRDAEPVIGRRGW